jgi:hypothetical protein
MGKCIRNVSLLFVLVVNTLSLFMYDVREPVLVLLPILLLTINHINLERDKFYLDWETRWTKQDTIELLPWYLYAST